MRLIFGIISLLITLVVVGLLARTQLEAVTEPQNPVFVRQNANAWSDAENLKLQPQQIPEHVRQSLEAAIKNPRTIDEE